VNPVLQSDWKFSEKFVQDLSIMMVKPEDVVIQQDDPIGDLFLIANGECDVFVENLANRS
jgi:hypothetical protein